MDARISEEAAPLSVIGCVKAGFDLVGRNLWLLAFPMSLDLLLWLGPRLSITPLLESLVSFLRVQFGSDPGLVPQISLLGDVLDQAGQRFNLLSLLSGLPLFTIPSLLSGHAPEIASPLGEAHVHLLTNVFTSILWGAGLVVVGLMLGVVFLGAMAQRMVAMRAPMPQLSPVRIDGPDQRLAEEKRVVRLVRVFVFAGSILVVAVCILPLWALAFGLAAMLLPMLGVLVWIMSIGLVSYLCLHLLFVAHSVLLGGRGLVRAIWESTVLIHSQLPSVAGLVILAFVTYQGLAQVWSLPSSDSWVLLVGILGNGCIATGLTAATFVFYEQRIPYALEGVRRRRKLKST